MNHDTSRGCSRLCQYRIDDSNPKWWWSVRWYDKIRKKATAINSVPMITWIPWNPVAKKNVLPYAPSEIVKGASQYSSPCSPVKITANTTVKIIPNNTPFRLPWISEWCAYVTVAPDESKIIVFSNGISNGLSGSIPAGGQCAPNSTVGAKAL